MFNALDISTSGMIAQRTRLNIISGNMANQFSTVDKNGGASAYRRRVPVFSVGDGKTGGSMGVHVKEILLDESTFIKKHEPGHPAADTEGYVEYPNVNPMIEMINAIEASRAYEANIAAAQATKEMINQALRLLA